MAFINTSPANNLTLSEIIGLVIGNIMGNNRIGKTKDLFLAYIENDDTIVPQIDKSIVGRKTPNNM